MMEKRGVTTKEVIEEENNMLKNYNNLHMLNNSDKEKTKPTQATSARVACENKMGSI